MKPRYIVIQPQWSSSFDGKELVVLSIPYERDLDFTALEPDDYSDLHQIKVGNQTLVVRAFLEIGEPLIRDEVYEWDKLEDVEG